MRKGGSGEKEDTGGGGHRKARLGFGSTLTGLRGMHDAGGAASAAEGPDGSTGEKKPRECEIWGGGHTHTAPGLGHTPPAQAWRLQSSAATVESARWDGAPDPAALPPALVPSVLAWPGLEAGSHGLTRDRRVCVPTRSMIKRKPPWHVRTSGGATILHARAQAVRQPPRHGPATRPPPMSSAHRLPPAGGAPSYHPPESW